MSAGLRPRPVGTIEPRVMCPTRTDADDRRADVLPLRGQVIRRADYPALWQYVSDAGAVGRFAVFGPGDGRSTFRLPDMRGLVVDSAGPARRGVEWVIYTGERFRMYELAALDQLRAALDAHGTVGR